MPPTYLIRPGPALNGAMTEIDRRSALGALDRIEARLGQDEAELLPTGGDILPEVPFEASPDLIYWPPTEPVQPSSGWEDILLKLIPIAGSAAAGYFKFQTTSPTPVYGPAPVSRLPAQSTGIPWWGWTLIGVGGLGALGVGFAIFRRLL